MSYCSSMLCQVFRFMAFKSSKSKYLRRCANVKLVWNPLSDIKACWKPFPLKYQRDCFLEN